MTNEFDPLFQSNAAKCGIDWELLKAQAIVESALNPHAMNVHTGAKGLAQFMDATWKEWGEGDPFDPAENIKAQAKYMAYLLHHYDGDVPLALAAYNWGLGHVDRLGYACAPTETKEYVIKIRKLL